MGASAHARSFVLVVGLAAIAAISVPELYRSGGLWLSACLWCCLAYFAFEWTVGISRAARSGRTSRYLMSAEGIIDMLSVLPVPIAILLGISQPTAWLFGAFWILKLAPRSAGFANLERVFRLEARSLTSVLIIFLIVLVLAATGMHVLERENQPDAFGSVPSALWWAVVTLTTAGYGDAIPHTFFGRLLAGAVMICGVGVFGLWTGILATGFAAEGRRRNFLQTWDLVSKVPFFQSLDPSAIAEITHMLRRLDVPERTTVIRRGRVGDCMYFLAAGEVEVEIGPDRIRLGDGAFFGELALLGDSVRTANVSTTQPSTLLILDLADFRTLSAHHPEVARAIDAEAKRRAVENRQRHVAGARDTALPTR
jgi:voltage-gated potassium channel